MANILAIATAGLKSDQLSDTDHRIYPRTDFVELKRYVDMDVLDYSAYNNSLFGGALRSVETQLRSDVYLAIMGLLNKNPYQLIFLMSERVGIPFAAMNQIAPGRKQLVSRLTNWSSRQEKLISRLNLFPSMGPITVMSESQKQYLIGLGVPPSQIHVIHYAVDQHYFRPMPEIAQEANLILTLGEVRTRNYNVLFQAVDGLPVKVLVAATGYWYAREKDTNVKTSIPSNIEMIGRLPQTKLRELYARSGFIVLPIYDVEYAAGVTAMLEAMCMGRAVIVTRSRGIMDYIVDGETGIVVDQDDTQGLREAISYLASHPEEAKRLGENARQRIEDELNMDTYLQRTAQVLCDQL